MSARLDGGLAMALVVVACGLATCVSVAFAEPPGNEGATARPRISTGQPDPGPAGAFVGEKLSAEEKARIAGLSEKELVNVLKTGTIVQVDEAIRALKGKDKGDVLLAAAKAGPPGASARIIELYVPTATAQSDAKAKKAVDAYLAFLEEQLKSKSPLVGPEWAVRSLARVAYLDIGRHRARPDEPRPEPPYQYQRVVRDLIGMLKHKRVLVSNEAVNWLGRAGGYTADSAREASAALMAHRRALAANTDPKEQKWKEMHLRMIDDAIKHVQMEQDRRAKATPTQPGPAPASHPA